MSVFITGDTHIPKHIHKLNSKNFQQGKALKKEDYVLVVGDFGLLWADKPDKEEKYWTKWLNNKPWTTLFIDGNHENHSRLTTLPTVQMFGNDAGKVSDSIFHLRRGRIYNIAGKSFFCLGGAVSTDRHSRIEGKSWWPEEVISRQDEERSMDSLESVNYKVDYIATHTLPQSLKESMLGYTQNNEDPGCRFLDHVLESTTFKAWYCGHFHTYREFPKNVRIIFEQIIELT